MIGIKINTMGGHEIGSCDTITSINPWRNFHMEAALLIASAMRSLISSLSPTIFNAEASRAITFEGLFEVESDNTVFSAELTVSLEISVTGAMFAVAAAPSSVANQEVRVRHSEVACVCHLILLR